MTQSSYNWKPVVVEDRREACVGCRREIQIGVVAYECPRSVAGYLCYACANTGKARTTATCRL